MTTLAFTDANGGYYQCESPDGSVPEWAAHMTLCAIQPPVAPPVVFTDLTPRQIRMALTQAGLRNQVESAVTASTDQTLKDWWGYSETFQRNHPMVLTMATGLGQTPAQIDALWKLGATL